MKILNVIDTLNMGGAENLLINSAPLIKKQGYDIEILVISNTNNFLYRQLVDSGIKVIRLNSGKVYSPLNLKKIREIILHGNYDIVHTHLFSSQLWTSLAVQTIDDKTLNTKFVTTEHNTHNRRRKFSVLKLLDRFIYSKYETVISISEDTEKELIKWVTPSKDERIKFKVIKNGVPILKYQMAKPYEKKDILPHLDDYNIKVICMVARFSEQKDQDTLIRAMELLPDNIHLVLIGGGPLIESHKELTNKLGLDKRIHFLGIRNDVENILKTVEIMVLSSHWEGFGLVAVEGMASGLPVVVSDVKGLNDIIDDSDLKFKVGNVKELVKILSRLLSDDKFYNQKVQYSNSRHQEFDIYNYISNLLAEYYNLLRKNVDI